MSNGGIGLGEIRAALENAGEPWQAGMTSIARLPAEERRRRLGVPGTARTAKASARPAAAAVRAPSAYDLRNVGGKNLVTPIKDQGSCGSCVSFGVVATVESTLMVQQGSTDPVDLSEAHSFFCHARDRGYNCSTGWWPNEALDDIRDKGVVDEACYPYNLANTDCSGLCDDWQNRLTRIAGYQDLTNKADAIKDWVSTRGPVSACFEVYEDFFYYQNGVYRHVTGDYAGGHCVTIVGYDDAQSCWICKNSWNTGWGEQGFFHIGYGECGIETWLNHGAEGVQVSGWINSTRVQGLWTINEERNAWAYLANKGWCKISPDNLQIFSTMLAQLVSAKTAGRVVNVYTDQNVIKQVYVF